MNFALTWLPDVLRSAGLNVVEEPGWKTRGHGDMHDVKGIVCHHTAGPMTGELPSLAIVRDGDESLSGPRANLMLSRAGVWHVIGAGVGYHAGKGSGFGLPQNNANPHMIGIEAENAGTAADPWPPAQMESYERGCAAMLKHIGAPVSMCIGHKEWAPGRKIDPSFDMAEFRTRVSAYMGEAA